MPLRIKQDEEDKIVAHTEITNSHKHRLKVYKEWSDGNDALPYVGLYKVEKVSEDVQESTELIPVEGKVKRTQKSADGKIFAEFNDLDPSKTYTVRELEECASGAEEFSIGSGAAIKYFKGIASGEYYQKYYQVSYTEPMPEKNQGETTCQCSQVMTIKNELRKAKIRVAKWIDNWDEADIELNDLYDHTVSDKEISGDEFTILIENDEAKFKTGVVLKHAGNGSETLDASKFSGYIEVPVGKDGTIYDINEIIPVEYRKSLLEKEEYVEYLSHYSENENEKGTVTIDRQNGTAEVTVKPGDDGLIIVHNTFEHEDYFHHDDSKYNNFAKKEKPKKGNPVTQKVELNGIVAEQRADGKWEQPDDDDVRLV